MAYASESLIVMGRVVSLNRSNGGVPKLPVGQAWVSVNGMEGDRQFDRRSHGGSERALSLYSLELLEQLRTEGHPIAAGAAGENVTLSGVDWTLMRPGARLELGDVEIELTTFAASRKRRPSSSGSASYALGALGAFRPCPVFAVWGCTAGLDTTHKDEIGITLEVAHVRRAQLACSASARRSTFHAIQKVPSHRTSHRGGYRHRTPLVRS